MIWLMSLKQTCLPPHSFYWMFLLPRQEHVFINFLLRAYVTYIFVEKPIKENLHFGVNGTYMYIKTYILQVGLNIFIQTMNINI